MALLSQVSGFCTTENRNPYLTFYVVLILWHLSYSYISIFLKELTVSLETHFNIWVKTNNFSLCIFSVSGTNDAVTLLGKW